MAPSEFLSIATQAIAEEEAADAAKPQIPSEAATPAESLEAPFADEESPRPESSPD
jgi:hypothetical protein